VKLTTKVVGTALGAALITHVLSPGVAGPLRDAGGGVKPNWARDENAERGTTMGLLPS
jgi:hypothetical protein